MIARNSEMVIASEQIHSLFKEYVKSGFTRKEALQIVVAHITTMQNK